MIKIFTMPIYGKNPLKIFFSGLERSNIVHVPWKLSMSIGDSGPTRFIQMVITGLP